MSLEPLKTTSAELLYISRLTLHSLQAFMTFFTPASTCEDAKTAKPPNRINSKSTFLHGLTIADGAISDLEQ